MQRRNFILSGLALPVLMAAQTPRAVMAAQAPRALRVVLLRQALLQHNLTDAQWPGAQAFTTLFAGADAVFTDLETAIKGPHAEAPRRNDQFLHAADAGVIDRLGTLGVNLFATSNNHAFDFGAGGIRDAVEALDTRGFGHAGTGLDLARAAAPGYVKTDAGTVALVAMASGNVAAGGMASSAHAGVNEVRRGPTNELDETDVGRYLAAIRAASGKADLVIAYQHNHYWEKNMADTPAWQRSLAHRAIEAGASIFASHGAPLLQGIEIYKGKAIFYDLGGFFFSRPSPSPGPTIPRSGKAWWWSVCARRRVSIGSRSRPCCSMTRARVVPPT